MPGYNAAMRVWSAVGLALLAACLGCRPEARRLSYAHVTQPAGSKVAYVDVRRHWKEYFTVDGTRDRWAHLGVLAVDLETFTARFVRGRELSTYRSHDVLGREYFDEYLDGGDGKPYRDVLVMRDPAGERHVLHTEVGDIQNVAVATRDGTAWAFYLRAVNVGNSGRRSGTWAVARVNVDTREATYLPFPPCGPRGTWDWLVPQDENVVFLTGGRRGGQVQTWRGDFASGTWADPIPGDFVVVDSQGTLIERRDPIWRRSPGLLPTQAEIIAKGGRRTIDLGLPGRIRPLFDCGRVVLVDPDTGRLVLRSLTGAGDRWLPATPPLEGVVELGSE